MIKPEKMKKPEIFKRQEWSGIEYIDSSYACECYINSFGSTEWCEVYRVYNIVYVLPFGGGTSIDGSYSDIGQLFNALRLTAKAEMPSICTPYNGHLVVQNRRNPEISYAEDGKSYIRWLGRITRIPYGHRIATKEEHDKIVGEQLIR